VGPRAGLDRCGKSRPHRDSIPGPSRPQPVAIPTELSGPRHLNVQILIYFIYLFTFALHVSGLLLAHLQRQATGLDGTIQFHLTQALTPYPRYLNHCRNFTPASKDRLKESPKLHNFIETFCSAKPLFQCY
jgi:hypothetical protein